MCEPFSSNKTVVKSFKNIASDEKSSSFAVTHFADTCPNLGASVWMSWGKCPTIQLSTSRTQIHRLRMKYSSRATISDSADTGSSLQWVVHFMIPHKQGKKCHLTCWHPLNVIV
jgi:hypothetical protein